MNQGQKSVDSERRVYTRPVITLVQLVAEEAVLVDCASGTESGCQPGLACVQDAVI